MALSWDDIQIRAVSFGKTWTDREGKEKQQAQMFVNNFLACFGITDPLEHGEYEHSCPKEIGDDGYIDYFSPKKIIIEMKTKGRSLDKAYEQVKDYVYHLPADEMPELVMVSDFENIILYHRTTGKKTPFKTKDLYKHVRLFADIAGYETTRLYETQLEVNVLAAEKMAKLHDALFAVGYEGHQLEVYLVRLLFCLFADDTGIFPKDTFANYIENSKPDGSDLSQRLAQLFEILNMSDENRKKRTLLANDLLQFRYINGGLFANPLNFADFNADMRKILLECCLFDWNKISPAIFGAMFQGVMDKEKRRELGAHYTSEENILKLINPLFLEDLWDEFEHVKSIPQKLEAFHNKIASLKFLDPACGCGNFLIITYRELRILELEVVKMLNGSNQMLLDISHMLKVSVNQFYGIEYEDFPCEIAKVGMWLMDHQMNIRFSELFGAYYARLPLTETATIIHANALTTDWETVVPKTELSYILGNPPFVGRRYRTAEQQSEIAQFFSYKDIDYVACWHMKASSYIKDTVIKVAFVSTNSICQGEQVSALWKPLFERHMHIDFAYRTFKWSNEAKGKAAVHCVIVGFSFKETKHERIIFDELGNKFIAKNINGYLVDAPSIVIDSRSKPICDVPPMKNGNVPLDGDALKIEKEDLHNFTDFPHIKKLIGGREFLHNEDRYVLWLVNVSPVEIKKYPEVYKRVELCRNNRLAMKDKASQKLAETPMTFRDTNNPLNYVVIPLVSSENRKYIPIGFLNGDTIPTNQIQTIPDATLYHFAILTSSVHMAWMRAVCGRLEMRYRYSKDIVYNNFPWADVTDEQKAKIETLALGILDAREQFTDSSLADLYDPLTMPAILLKAHQALDKEVLKVYGFKANEIEANIVAKLMERYDLIRNTRFTL